MDWWYIWGDKVQMLEDRSDAVGHAVPALAAQPVLTPEATEVCRAFKLLTKLRGSNGFGLNPIGLGDISEYIKIFGAPWFGKEDFVNLIVIADTQLRTLQESKAAEPKPVKFGEGPMNLKAVSGRRDITDSS